MKKLTLFLLLAAGCGGSGTQSPFTGTYAGTWSDFQGVSSFKAEVSCSGDSVWTLSDGRIVTGTIQPDGKAVLIVRHPPLLASGEPFSGSLRYSSGQIVTISFSP